MAAVCPIAPPGLGTIDAQNMPGETPQPARREGSKVRVAVVDEPKGTARTYGYATGGWVAAPAIRSSAIVSSEARHR